MSQLLFCCCDRCSEWNYLEEENAFFLATVHPQGSQGKDLRQGLKQTPWEILLADLLSLTRLATFCIQPRPTVQRTGCPWCRKARPFCLSEQLRRSSTDMLKGQSGRGSSSFEALLPGVAHRLLMLAKTPSLLPWDARTRTLPWKPLRLGRIPQLATVVLWNTFYLKRTDPSSLLIPQLSNSLHCDLVWETL